MEARLTAAPHSVIIIVGGDPYMNGLKHEGLELTDEMIARNDEIDNTVYQCILTLTEKDPEELDWDMAIIGEVTDAIIETLREFGLKVRHPGVVTDLDGSQYYANYDFEEDEPVANDCH